MIIAGFGRFGQIVGRLLFASGTRATVLDHDPDQIETLRKFGFRVFYGDATRLDLLQSAGAAHAKLLVIALDDVSASIKLAELAQEHFPHLRIVARARNVSHYIKLRQLKVRHIERETFESALRIGRRALEHMGTAPYEARGTRGPLPATQRASARGAVARIRATKRAGSRSPSKAALSWKRSFPRRRAAAGPRRRVAPDEEDTAERLPA